MKKFFSVLYVFIFLFSLSACGGKHTDAPTPSAEPEPTAVPAPAVEIIPAPTAEPVHTPEPPPLQPELPPVYDEALTSIFNRIIDDVRPGTAGCSLRAAQIGASLLDWGMATALTDDEIYSAVGCFLEEQEDERLQLFFESFFSVYDSCYDLMSENGPELLDCAGVSDCSYPWNDRALHSVEMVCYGCGLR